ncbi:hypothetical protein [Clostridium muellerianum]|nr:hypothetical protein [Clostridium muellerianum]
MTITHSLLQIFFSYEKSSSVKETAFTHYFGKNIPKGEGDGM